MHTVCLGVAKNFLNHMYTSLQPMERRIVNQRAKGFKMPFEFQRSVRRLDQMSHFKASEFKRWLLYVAPVVTLDLLAENISNLLWKFFYAIRFLLESDEHLTECDQLLNDFCAGFADIDSAEQIFNLHSLRHLTWQVRNYGPLWTASCFAFESAHHSLVSAFTGSVNHLRLLVERYLVKKSLLRTNLENDALFNLTSELISGRKKIGQGHLKDTVDVRELCGRASSVSAREVLNGLAFDSASDTKSNSNSFITFSPIGADQLIFGQVIAFFRRGRRKFCLVELYAVQKSFKCPGGDRLPCAFDHGKTTNERIDLPCERILGKLIVFSFEHQNILIKLSSHFDHN